MSPFLQHALHVAAHALGMALAWHLGRRCERRQHARAQALVAPILKLGIESFNRADAASARIDRGARIRGEG